MATPSSSVAMDFKALDRWAQQAQAGDREAFTQIILATHVSLRCWVATMARSPDHLEEMVHGTYVTAFQHLSTYELRGTLLPWLKGIAKNGLRHELRERQRWLQVEPDVIEQLLVDDSQVQLGLDQELQDQRSEAVHHLNGCLSELPVGAQTLLDRYYREGLTLNQLAQRFKKNRAALAMTLSRLRGQLRICLERKGTRS